MKGGYGGRRIGMGWRDKGEGISVEGRRVVEKWYFSENVIEKRERGRNEWGRRGL